MDGKREFIDVRQLDRITFKPSNIKEFWQGQALKNGIYENIFRNGMQYGARKIIEDETMEYVNRIEESNLIFDDSYLESYLYSKIYKIYPEKLEDGRPGILCVKILKDITPNAFIYPNGTLFITTGLLSTLNSESELIGVLAHEVSHFVLDHSIININKAVERQKRAEFWAGLATGIAAAADIYTASTNEYYSPGLLTMSTAIIAYDIASKVHERLGLKYSQAQEMEADNCAIELMKFINVDPRALSTALDKIKTYCIVTGNYLALTDEGTHPSLNTRIKAIGEPVRFDDQNYDVYVSFVNSFNAIWEFERQHFSTCSILVSRNIKAKVATEDDYLLLAMISLYLYDNNEKNMEAYSNIIKAKNLKVFPPITLSKLEAIVCLRLGKNVDALNCLEKYLESLADERVRLGNILNQKEWSHINSFINKEEEWEHIPKLVEKK